MDLVDEEDIAILEIGEERRKVAGLRDHRPRGRAEPDAELSRDDLRERRLAEAGRPHEQHVVERGLALLGGLDEHLEVGARGRLADELGKAGGAQRDVERIVAAGFGGGDGRSTTRAP